MSTSCISCRRRKSKCDRTRPRCGKCFKLGSACDYPVRKRRYVLKTRTVKQLEAKLAQVEAQLRLQSNSSARGHTIYDKDKEEMRLISAGSALPENYGADDGCHSLRLEEMDESSRLNSQSRHKVDSKARDPLDVTLREPLPPEDTQMELFQIYFYRINPRIPIIHKGRFYDALKLDASQRPPVCLRYAIWSLATLVSPKYESLGDIFYERALRYVETDELTHRGGIPLSLYSAQCWHLIATFEVKRTYLSRTWISTGKCVRLVQIMGLQCIDRPDNGVRSILPPAKNFIELEERRRTFWAAYFGDRWASLGTGWPMMINEAEIFTNLPVSEVAFEEGIWQPSISLSEALSDKGASKLLSPFSGFLVAVTLLGRDLIHIHRIGNQKNHEDLEKAAFWLRHHEIDTTISSTLTHLPEHLKLPRAFRDQDTVLFHMCLHVSAICLHQASVVVALEDHLETSHKTRSMERCLSAADEITTIMKMVSHFDVLDISPWAFLCLYLAGRVYCNDIKFGHPPKLNSSSNLDFLLLAMKQVGKSHVIVQPFTCELESEVKSIKLASSRAQNLGMIAEAVSNISTGKSRILSAKVAGIDATGGSTLVASSSDPISNIISSSVRFIPDPPLFGITIQKNRVFQI